MKGFLTMYIKLTGIKEHKKGGATITVEFDKEVEKTVCDYYKVKKFSNKLIAKFIKEGLANYLENDTKST